MKKTLIIIFTSVIILGSLFYLPSCKKDTIIDPTDSTDALDVFLGWLGLGGDGDDLAGIEDDINFGAGSVAESVDLSANFPPIGDQGSYGTCVAWAVGYNHKSYMDARSQNRTSFTNNQKFSPKYLFWKIPVSQKGADCNGTGFEPAYDVMLSAGIADLAASPYTSLGNCASLPSTAENSNASNNKILSYREVEVTIATLKQYLSQGRALSFGAKLGDSFMSWSSSSDVLYSDTYGYSGQHAYHAMILCGYDDNKGSNGAFKVVNSWGTSWGNAGYIWVDYNFFVNGNFAFCAFAATNANNPDGDGDNEVDDPVSGTDLTAWEFELDTDVDGISTKYTAYYNVYNTGTTTVNATNDWNILLLYYNAYDAEDNGIILFDYYTDDYDTDVYYPNNFGDMGSGVGLSNYWNWVNVQSGHSVAWDWYYPNGDSDTRFAWTYDMSANPDMLITGDYYLVIIADGYDDIDEVDEDNNYFFMTDINGEPIHFTNGVIDDVIAKKSHNRTVTIPKIGEESSSPTARTKKNLNTYTRDEIINMIKYEKESGILAEKAAKFLNSDRSKLYKKTITNK